MALARQNLFCYFCAELGNPREAAVRAGYPAGKADRCAASLLQKKEVRELIDEYAQIGIQNHFSSVRKGLERIAFGSANDAVSLLLSEEDPNMEKLAALDLFCVSEIKKLKGGGIEIKLADRLKAMTLMDRYTGDADAQACSLYKALEQGARAVGAGICEDEAVDCDADPV